MGAGILPVERQHHENIAYVAKLAAFIADVGKERAGQDTQATKMLRQMIRILYEGGGLPADALEEISIQQILDDPEKFIFPPVKTLEVISIESCLRASRTFEAMA